jgi:CMP-N,N'-diacetyllegionaminic acid synthase
VKVLALIPARSGSKGILHKNVQMVAGKPMLAHSIEQARACPAVDRVIVSTDSEDYAAIARQYEAETPFLRPAEISGDSATDWQVFHHALDWLGKHEGAVPDIVVHLRPTHPRRNPADIATAVELLRSHPEWDSVRSVVPAPHTPYKMWLKNDDGTLRPVATCDKAEAYNEPRQVLPDTYLQNACIDVTRAATVLEKQSMTGEKIGALLMTEFQDIDTPEELEQAAREWHRPGRAPSGKTFVFDIDGVIARLASENDYRRAQPQEEIIAIVRQLHRRGNRIILHTARGFVTGIDWRETTRQQLAAWDVPYHELHFGKPAGDYYVDDRMIALSEIRRLARLDV